MARKIANARLCSVKGSYAELSRLWILRLYKAGFASYSKGAREELENQFGATIEAENHAQFRQVTAALLESVEHPCPVLNGVLSTNLMLLGKYFRLNNIERDIFAFRAIYRINQTLKNTLDEVVSGPWTDDLTFKVLRKRTCARCSAKQHRMMQSCCWMRPIASFRIVAKQNAHGN